MEADDLRYVVRIPRALADHLWWTGEEWSSRQDYAKQFNTAEEAQAALAEAVTIEPVSEQVEQQWATKALGL